MFEKIKKIFKRDEKEDLWYDEVNWDNVTQEQIEFGLNESKEMLKNTIENNDKLQTKNFFICKTLIATLTFLIGFFVTGILKSDFYIHFSIMISCFIVALLCSISCCCANSMFLLGNKPKKIFSKNALEGNYKDFLACEMLTYDNSLNHNQKVNKKLGRMINYSIYFTVSAVIVPIIYHLMLL